MVGVQEGNCLDKVIYTSPLDEVKFALAMDEKETCMNKLYNSWSYKWQNTFFDTYNKYYGKIMGWE
jgi:hypothetical protein